MSFFGNVMKAFGSLLGGAANGGAAGGQAGARPGAMPAMPQVQGPPPPGGPVNAGKRVDKRTMAMSPLPADWQPGMPMPPGWGANPDQYPHDVGGGPGPTSRYVGLPEGMQDPDAMGEAPWGKRKMSDEAIVAWYRNQHAAAMGNMSTVPAFGAHAANANDPTQYGPGFAATQADPFGATQPGAAFAPTQRGPAFAATQPDPFGATMPQFGRTPMGR